MNSLVNNKLIQRYVGLDLDKRSIVVAAVDNQQQLLLQPRRINLDRFEKWATQNLTQTDAVTLEATTNAWLIYDLLADKVGYICVAHPLLIKLITAARVKTDAVDACRLARLLAARLIPEIWVPPQPVRELRGLVSHRNRLVRQRTQIQNRLWAILHRHNLVPPQGSLFSDCHRQWWQQQNLSLSEKLRANQDISLLDSVQKLIEQLEETLAQISRQEPWATQLPYLIQLPGLGLISALVLLSAIGDITRFPSAKHLVGYSGLGAGIHASGQTLHTGSITKQGRSEIRTVMVEAAWSAVEHHPYWKEQFERLVVRLGKNKAITAIARKLLVVVWHVLTKQTADRNAVAEKVALKLVIWGRKLQVAKKENLKTSSFVRQQLQHLGIGETLTEIGWPSSKKMRLPPAPLAIS